MFQASFPLAACYGLVMVWIWGCYTTEIRRKETETSHGFPLLLSNEEHASLPHGHVLCFRIQGNSCSLHSHSTTLPNFSHHGSGWIFLPSISHPPYALHFFSQCWKLAEVSKLNQADYLISRKKKFAFACRVFGVSGLDTGTWMQYWKTGQKGCM